MPKPFGNTHTFHTNDIKSLGALFPNLNRYRYFQPYGYTEIFENMNNSSYELQELIVERIRDMYPFGIIYVHTSPCLWAIQTAMDIAAALNRGQLKATVRIDDKISSSCFQSAAERIIALQSLLAYLDTLKPGQGLNGKYLDRIWLDQRLYSLESDFSIADNILPRSSIKDIFSENNYPDPFAGLIIVGEVDFCTPLLQAEPFPWTLRPPRECEVYEITCIGLESYNRKYIGRFVPRTFSQEPTTKLSQPQVSEAPSRISDDLQPQAGKRSASPILSESSKRTSIPP